MTDVASKQQTIALFYPPQSHAQEDTLNWGEKKKKRRKKPDLMGNLCCAKKHSFQSFVQFLTHLNCKV
jgi:hypothetical protein